MYIGMRFHLYIFFIMFCVHSFIMLIWSPTVVFQHLSKGDKRGWLTRWPPRSFASPMWHSAPLCLHWSAIVPKADPNLSKADPNQKQTLITLHCTLQSTLELYYINFGKLYMLYRVHLKALVFLYAFEESVDCHLLSSFWRWFKLAHISIQVCTFHDGFKQGIDQQIFNFQPLASTS